MYFGLVVARLSWVDSAWFVTSQSIKVAGSCSERSSHCGAVAFYFTAVRTSSPPPPLTLIPERYQTPRVQRLDDSTGRPVQRPWKSAGTVSARYSCLGQRGNFFTICFCRRKIRTRCYLRLHVNLVLVLPSHERCGSWCETQTLFHGMF